jgi:hypothetical protein
LTEAYRQNKIVLESCNNREKSYIKADLQSKRAKLDGVIDVLDEILPEEKAVVEEKKKPAFESVGASVKMAASKPTTKKSVSRRSTTKKKE